MKIEQIINDIVKLRKELQRKTQTNLCDRYIDTKAWTILSLAIIKVILNQELF